MKQAETGLALIDETAPDLRRWFIGAAITESAAGG